MSDKLTWQFSANDANEIEGPNDPGITHFMNDREESIIREAIQNSLDAQADPDRPVRVNFDHHKISTASFGEDDLAASLNAAAVSPHLNDAEYVEQFKQGARHLSRNKGGSLNCLRIVDSNTHGATDEPRDDGAPSKWEALTKGTGSNAKDQKDAAGSFGLGKFAAFAATKLRTVLYSVAYESTPGQLHRRFQGKTILVSHVRNNQNFRKTGYFGKSDFRPAKDTDVPRPFMLQEPGTALYIVGYEPKERWQGNSASTVAKHFFHAIVRGKLEVALESRTIKSDNIAEFAGPVNGKTANFVRVSQLQPYAETDIPGIGHVTIRIEDYKDSPGKREIALVRDAGMMITDRPGDMNMRGLGRIPQHWKGFTAIIECLSKGEQSLLRDSESPQHNRISVDYISDDKRKREALKQLNELGQWCRDRIAALVEPQLSDEDNAGEIGKYLPLPEDDGEQQRGGNRGNNGKSTPVISRTPYQAIRPPARIRLRGSGSRGQVIPPGTKKEDPDVPPDPRLRKRTPRTPRPRTPTNAPTAFAKTRFRQGGSAYSVAASFDNPKEPLFNVQLVAVGEDGQDVPVGIREAFVNGQSLTVSQDRIQRISDDSSERLLIEFTTREPIPNKTFYLKGDAELK